MSSPIVHIAAGSVIYAFCRRYLPREKLLGIKAEIAWPLVVLFCAMVPDVDAGIGWLMGNMERFHNNLSHSIIVCIALAAVATGLLKLFSKVSLRVAFIMTSLCLFSHLAIDLLTHGRGLLLFWPFSLQRYSGPSLLTGVPWSSELTSPLYLRMMLEDVVFSAGLIVAPFLARFFYRKAKAGSD